MKFKKIAYMPIVLMLVLSSLVIIGAGYVPPSPGTWLHVDPDPKTFNTAADLVCTHFTVDINVYNVTYMGAYSFKLYFNNTLLNASSVTPGPASANVTKWLPVDGVGTWIPINNAFNSTHGEVWVATIIGSGKEFYGSGTLVTIDFHIIYAPAQLSLVDNEVNCSLTFGSWEITDGMGSIITTSADDGFYQYIRQGFVPGTPTAAFTWSPPSPYVGDTVAFDASASTDGGYPPLTYDWDLDGNGVFGDASTVNPTYVYTSAGTYTVGLKVTNAPPSSMSDTVYHNVTVTLKLGASIDVFTQPERQYPDLLTDYTGKGVFVDCDSFAPGENVTLFANVTYNDEIVQDILVGFEVLDPLNRCVTYRVDLTDVDGIAQVWFRIPIPCSPAELAELFGHWTVIAKCKLQDDIINDTMHFKVGYIVDITVLETIPYDEWYKCESIGINVTLKNIAWMARNVTLIVVVYDECDVPIGQVVYRFEINEAPATLCSSFVTTINLSLHVPKWAYVGQGNVFANAFTEKPQNCGIPYCPEEGYSIIIKKGTR